MPLGSPARAISPAALPLSSTASTAREYARALDAKPASASASRSSSCALRAAATAHAVSSARLAALTARRSTAPPARRGHWDVGRPDGPRAHGTRWRSPYVRLPRIESRKAQVRAQPRGRGDPRAGMVPGWRRPRSPARLASGFGGRWCMTVMEGGWRRPERPTLDRGAERAAVDERLDDVRRGLSGVLVLRGGPGVGKTTLADYAIETASGFQVSAIIGVESEITLAYGAVQRLVVPFLPLIGDLPGAQRQAIGVAVGLEAGPPPDGFLVGLACLTLISRGAADQPVLCVVDDAHWIDAESARALGCMARRLYADRVGMIVTVDGSGGSPAFEQLPAIEVGGLPHDAAAELLRSVVGTPLDPQAVDRVLADTECNPLALVEVGSQFTAGELAERAYQLEPIPVGERLKDRYLRRVRGLPADAREFLLLAAADVSGDLGLVRRAAAEAGIDADAAEKAAESAGLIEVSGSMVRFAHPLKRAAVYHGVTDADRRRASLA